MAASMLAVIAGVGRPSAAASPSQTLPGAGQLRRGERQEEPAVGRVTRPEPARRRPCRRRRSAGRRPPARAARSGCRAIVEPGGLAGDQIGEHDAGRRRGDDRARGGARRPRLHERSWRSPPDADAEQQPVARDVLQGRDLLGRPTPTGRKRHDHDAVGEADPGRGGRRGARARPCCRGTGTPVPATSWSTTQRTRTRGPRRGGRWRPGRRAAAPRVAHGREEDADLRCGHDDHRFSGAMVSSGRFLLVTNPMVRHRGRHGRRHIAVTEAHRGIPRGLSTAGRRRRATGELTQTCEIRDLLDRLADKWSLLVVELLGQGTQRFSRAATRDRRHQPAHADPDPAPARARRAGPPHGARRSCPRGSTTTLTPLGASLLEAIEPLVAWTRAHRDEIAIARTVYDDTNVTVTGRHR